MNTRLCECFSVTLLRSIISGECVKAFCDIYLHTQTFFFFKSHPSKETKYQTQTSIPLFPLSPHRFVEPIDRTGYKQWSSSSCVRGCPDEQLDQTASSHSDSELTAETSEPTETKQLSFAEVMRLVQEGKEVPGVTKVDIQPSNRNPTPSRMERMLKPWETASSSPE